MAASDQRHLGDEDPDRDGAGRGALERLQQALEVLPARGATSVAPHLAAEARLGDRVAVVEVHVGLVRPELVLVVGEVPAAVPVERHEGRVGDQPATDGVVPALVREQELVRGLVAEDGEAGEGRAHEHEGRRVREGVTDPDGQADGDEGLQPRGDDRAGVAQVVDLAQLRSQRWHRHARGREAIRGQHVGEELLRREHRRPGVQHGDHAGTLHSHCTCLQHVTLR